MEYQLSGIGGAIAHVGLASIAFEFPVAAIAVLKGQTIAALLAVLPETKLDLAET
jgi:hypothetical protein